jgi:hypothetical protein
VSEIRTARAYIADHLKPLLPKSWKFVPYFTNLDVQNQTVAMLLLESAEHAPAARDSHVLTFTLQLREPKTDPARREDSLDATLDELIFALDEIPGLWWSDAKRVLHGEPGNESLSFDISLSLLVTPNTETEA